MTYRGLESLVRERIHLSPLDRSIGTNEIIQKCPDHKEESGQNRPQKDAAPPNRERAMKKREGHTKQNTIIDEFDRNE